MPGPLLQLHEFCLQPKQFGLVDGIGDLAPARRSDLCPFALDDAPSLVAVLTSTDGISTHHHRPLTTTAKPQKLVQCLAQQPRQQIDIAHRVAVGIDAEIQHPVIRRHADGQRLVVQ